MPILLTPVLPKRIPHGLHKLAIQVAPQLGYYSNEWPGLIACATFATTIGDRKNRYRSNNNRINRRSVVSVFM